VTQNREAVAGEEEKGIMLKDDGEDKKMVEENVRVRDWWNIFRKWFTDVSMTEGTALVCGSRDADTRKCITMGALLNQSMFLILMGIMKSKSVALIVQDFRNVRINRGVGLIQLMSIQELFGLIFDSYKVWPIANFFSTTYFHVERRMIFLSFCGLLWNIYLSLVAARL